jgi:hypothetical protein
MDLPAFRGLCGLGHGLGHGGAHAAVERLGDDIVRGELLIGDEPPGRGGGHLHLLVDVARAHVERAAEDAREGQNVVDLVRVVAAARRDDAAPPALASSGKISGVGLAQAKMIASLFMVFTMSVVTVPGAETPMNTSAPTSMSARLPAFLQVGDLGHLLLDPVHAVFRPS